MDKTKIEILQELLINAGYPNIRYKDTAFIKTILSKENRIQLLTWAYAAMQSQVYDCNLSEHSVTILPSFLTNNGFCRSNEVEGLLTKTNLKFSEEFVIFKRIFNYIIRIRNTTLDDTIYLDGFMPESLAEVLTREQHVLPAYLMKKGLSDTQKQELFERTFAENNELEAKIHELETNVNRSENVAAVRVPNRLLSNLNEIDEKFQNFVTDFTFVKKMNGTKADALDIEQMNKSATVQESLDHLNGLLKTIEKEKYLRQLEHAVPTNDVDVNTENILILEKTLCNLNKIKENNK